MRAKNRHIVRLLAVILSVIITVSCMIPASAFDWSSLLGGLTGDGNVDYLRIMLTALNAITSDNGSVPAYIERLPGSLDVPASTLADYQEVLDKVNADLNKIKQQKPGFVKTANVGLPEGEGSSKAQTILDEISSKIGLITSILFGADNKITVEKVMANFGLEHMFAETRVTNVERGQDCKNYVSVAGEDFVSNLTAEDVYYLDYNQSRFGGYNARIYLYDCVNPTIESAQGRVFDLLSETKFYESLASMAPNASFNTVGINYVDNYIDVTVNKNGEVTSYTTHFSCMIKINATTGLDQYLSFDDTPLYKSDIMFSNFRWTTRPSGDVNDDDITNAADARLALRAAAELITLSEGATQCADIDGDGKVKAADARQILRIAAGLV